MQARIDELDVEIHLANQKQQELLIRLNGLDKNTTELTTLRTELVDRFHKLQQVTPSAAAVR
jgi:hypothetical protein